MSSYEPVSLSFVQDLARACTLDGDFLLRSGERSSRYFDKYQFEARPTLLRPLAVHMARFLDRKTELLAGLELGGIPLATAISLETGLSTVFVRKQAKAYGTCKAIEGPSAAGKNVTVIEDVVTTGGAIIDSVSKLRAEGAIVNEVVCAIWRGSSLDQLEQNGLALKWALCRDDLDRALS
jgi:orotate phosphoribosyltransferase